MILVSTRKGDYNVSVTMWVRSSVLDKGLDAILFKTVKQWLKEKWPMEKVGYPCRDISWVDWRAL